jgi:LmbE family N-acetylglucosaminyl deacetylase
MIRCLVVLMLLSPTLASADAGSLAHALDRLATTGRVLYIAAHPDDENTRLLAYLANVRHFEVAYLSMTRGGGGQNLIGSEQGELLDVIRTEELVSARRLDGARQYFTRMRDFGYSKRADETLAVWGREAALADVVWVIRSFQPDVIITRFDEQPPNHGHHTASAILAREAFSAAADPKRFPEQLARGVTVWQADRLLHNFASWRKQPPADALVLDVGAYDPRLGVGMGELAARSRSQHKSQGFGVAAQRGPILEHFIPIAGTRPAKDAFGGLAVTWRAPAYTRAIADAQRRLERDHPERAVPALARAHAALAKLPESPRVRDARTNLAEVLAAAAGVYARAAAKTATATPGASVEVALELVARAGAFAVERIELAHAPVIATTKPIKAKEVVTLTATLPAHAAPTQPFAGGDPSAPRERPPLEVALDVTIAKQRVRLVRPVVHTWTDRVHGERERLFTIAPPATVTPLREAVLAAGRAAPLEVRVRAGRDGLTGRVELALPAGWRAQPAHHDVTLAKAGDEVTVRFAMSAAANAAGGTATPQLRIGGALAPALREDVIDYPHIPLQLVLRPAAVRLVPLAIKIPAGRIGFVRGSGESLPDDLAHVGFTVDELDDTALRTADLSRYRAIVIGIRAYNARPAVAAAHPRLLAYVERGGTMIVQYNTVDLLGPVGPYKLDLSRDRITDETAAPTFLDPKHPVVTTPNALSAADFTGWVQERGIYFGANWDPRYKPLLRFADPGEQPLDGALLVAQHGKGRYIYTGLAMFRQLPAGVPGAYRLFANLIAGGAP